MLCPIASIRHENELPMMADSDSGSGCSLEVIVQVTMDFISNFRHLVSNSFWRYPAKLHTMAFNGAWLGRADWAGFWSAEDCSTSWSWFLELASILDPPSEVSLPVLFRCLYTQVWWHIATFQCLSHSVPHVTPSTVAFKGLSKREGFHMNLASRPFFGNVS